MIEQAQIQLDGLEGAQVLSLHGREAINELSKFVLDVLSDDARIDPARLVDRDAIVAIADAGGETTHFHLAVLQASHCGSSRRGHRYRVTLGPPVARLLWRVNHEIFQEKTTQQITAELLDRVGFPSSLVKWRLAGQYAQRTYTVQYAESDWAFISRLLADEGINYWFDRGGGDSLLIFGDHPNSHDGIEGEKPVVPFQDASGMNTSSFAFHSLRQTWSLTSTKVVVRDVDVQNRSVPVDGEAGNGALEVFEYPSNLTIPEAATARARVRLEQLNRNRITLSAESANARIRAGRVVEIIGAADDCFSGKFLITGVEHELQQSSPEHGDGIPYRNRATLVPLSGEAPHRPAAPEERPTIDGLENAIVTGPPGEEIHVDDLGRVKVRFFWDRSGIGDDRTSRWIRTLQMNLTAPQMLPRVGWEVPIVYENGNPDRPFVLGRLYNGGAPPPYGLPGKKATSTLQSATSPSDGTTQEIRFGDDAGSEETFIHATKDQSVVVGGSHKVEVTAQRTDDVQKSQTLEVGATQTATISGHQKVTVGANGTIAVKGARSETIGGNELIGVTGNYDETIQGADIEIVGGFYSLRCNQAKDTIQGTFTQAVGGALLTTAGLGMNQSVAGARSETVGGSRAFSAGLAYADGTTGIKKISAGAANESANVDIAITAGARAQVTAGGAMSLEGGGQVVFEAAKISVKAATLTANGGSTMKLAGKLKASAKVKLDAPIVKKKKKVEVR